MSSEVPNSLLDWLRGSPERHRLHSLGYKWFARAFALLLCANSFRLYHREVQVAAERGLTHALIEGLLLALLLGLATLAAWTACPPVVATRAGLEVGNGKALRLIPWDRVHDVREMPWIRRSPPWYPKRFQVDLEGGEAFEFVGDRRSREIVLEFWRNR